MKFKKPIGVDFLIFFKFNFKTPNKTFGLTIGSQWITKQT